MRERGRECEREPAMPSRPENKATRDHAMPQEEMPAAAELAWGTVWPGCLVLCGSVPFRSAAFCRNHRPDVPMRGR